MTAEEKLLTLDALAVKVKAETLTIDESTFLLQYIDELLRLMPVVHASRSLMIDLGRGNRDVSFALAEIHNSLRALDGKDYLAIKGNIIT